MLISLLIFLIVIGVIFYILEILPLPASLGWLKLVVQVILGAVVLIELISLLLGHSSYIGIPYRR